MSTDTASASAPIPDLRLITPLLEPYPTPELPRDVLEEMRSSDAPSARIPWVLDYMAFQKPITMETLRHSVEAWVHRKAGQSLPDEYRIVIDEHRFVQVARDHTLPYPLSIVGSGGSAAMRLSENPGQEAGNVSPISATGFPLGVWGVLQQWIEVPSGGEKFAKHLRKLPAWESAQSRIRSDIRALLDSKRVIARWGDLNESELDTLSVEDVIDADIEPKIESTLAIHSLPVTPSSLRFAIAEAMRAEGIGVESVAPMRGLLVESILLAPCFPRLGAWSHLHVDVVTTVCSSNCWGSNEAWRTVERVATHHRSWWEDWVWRHSMGSAASDLGQENTTPEKVLAHYPEAKAYIEQMLSKGAVGAPRSPERKRFMDSVFGIVKNEIAQRSKAGAKGHVLSGEAKDQIRSAVSYMLKSSTGTTSKRMKPRFRTAPGFKISRSGQGR